MNELFEFLKAGYHLMIVPIPLVFALLAGIIFGLFIVKITEEPPKKPTKKDKK